MDREFYFALARHYGFTKEELDFIINYDIKYSMGRERLRGKRINSRKEFLTN